MAQAPTDSWLFKSEPQTFSWGDLEASPHQTTRWDGVRNYQARNFLRDRIKKGDQVFFYHSSCAHPGIIGITQVVRPPYPDPTQFDAKSPYFDALSKAELPRWWSVDVQAQQRFDEPISRQQILAHPGLGHLELCRRGSRLSVSPIDPKAWKIIYAMAKRTKAK